METETYTFLKNIIGRNIYNELKRDAKQCIPVATVVLIVVLVLTYFFHWKILSWILNLITGTSLIFIAYIIGIVLLLDFGVNVKMTRSWDGSYKMPNSKPFKYHLTKFWEIILVVLAIAAIYFSNKYRRHYAFECETFLVDENSGIYHLEEGNDDEECNYTTKMKGYEIEELGYSFCESCKDWVEEAEEVYESERYSRR